MSDTAGRTLGIAAALCGVCSVLVAGAVVVLRPMQNANKEKDFKKNILMSAGLLKPGTDINAVYSEKVEPIVVNLETGELATDVEAKTYVQDKADKDPAYVEDIPKKQDVAGIKRRAKYQMVYLVKEGGQLDQIVLHVYGKGLWSTMKGFLSLAKDGNTVKGFNYYAHGETPGLGGEVDNPGWIAQWPGKEVYTEDMKPAINVIKGTVADSDPGAKYKIDGLSGATLTSVGIENTFKFWLSDMGYKKFLENVRSGSIQ